MKKKLSWGGFPLHNYKFRNFNSINDLNKIDKTSIPFGNGRSYGDCCIGDNVISLRENNKIINFDILNGTLHVQSGVLFKNIIDLIVPKGWFFCVTPGTKYLTVGGAIASDIHGKNHHIDGCFSEFIDWFSLLLPTGELLKCSKTQNSELFFSTCGGMGLTGYIIEANIKLKKINSSTVIQKTIKAKNLKETFAAFELIKNEPYSVAWIDCLAKKNIGRSLIISGKFDNDNKLTLKKRKIINVPFNFPSFFLNEYLVKIFNFLYYGRVLKKESISKVYFDKFFYPLDSIKNWNRIYGKKGFVQYQFILPKKNSYEGLMSILTEISNSGKGSFLAVLKLYGKENENYLSFPLEGYSLALDFKVGNKTFNLLKKLDEIVNQFNGRIYLAKDAILSKENFEKGYPKKNEFLKIRKKYNLENKLESLQSKRLGI